MTIPSLFRRPAFLLFWAGRFLATTAAVMQSVAIGWLVYTIARQTHNERVSMLYVGGIGLAEFLPMFAIALFAGQAVDKYDRLKILIGTVVLNAFCAGAFTLAAIQPNVSLTVFFVISCFLGIARAFMMPVGSALLPMLVSAEELPRAIAWNALSIQGAIIVGPWIGGVLCAISPAIPTGIAFAIFVALSFVGLWATRMKINTTPKFNGASRFEMIREGLAYLWKTKIVFGALTLDLFAMLLGGVTALLPAYARDILQTGPEGFGHLRMAFALGASMMTLGLALRPIRHRIGLYMLGGVALFGIATLFFALSKTEALSMLALAFAGMGDSISVFTRQSLIQIVTPDHMRGRVSAVSGLFISATNELGEFESGVAARLFGVIGSAIFGGVGALVVTGVWAKAFPDLRKADSFSAEYAASK